ncbi:MAG TPA: ABC transporter ATP-binding protein [Candidatus Deferrimicrobiaceae bacterium]|nr:ABC transporter ATP-binding protein [Candidatus Deferrimicrobiaceae bacterium]
MLEVRGLEANYGSIQALKGIDLTVEEGTIACMIGANGAGKTTFMRTVAGLHAPAGGKVLYRGEEITGLPPAQVVRKGIVLVPEGRAILSRMTVLENLEMGAYPRGDGEVTQDLERVMNRFPVLGERIRQRGGSLSGGEQQMLAIARALLARPRLLLLDEPSLGLAPLVVSAIFRIIREINQEGTTVLLVEQNVRQALKASRHAYVLETGRIVHRGSSKDLLNDPRIMQAYLGGPS